MDVTVFGDGARSKSDLTPRDMSVFRTWDQIRDSSVNHRYWEGGAVVLVTCEPEWWPRVVLGVCTYTERKRAVPVLSKSLGSDPDPPSIHES